jgi:hypothetical protein
MTEKTKMSDSTSDATAAGYFCNLGAMNSEERVRYGKLSRQLSSGAEEKRELQNGYAFRLSSQKISILEIAEWITFERRCCPFFNLQIEAEPHDGPVWLRMTGGEGIKEFIRSETGA